MQNEFHFLSFECVILFLIIINVSIRASLHAPRLITRVLKLTTM